MPQSSLCCACSLHPVLLALDATAPPPFWEGPGLCNQEEPKRRLSGVCVLGDTLPFGLKPTTLLFLASDRQPPCQRRSSRCPFSIHHMPSPAQVSPAAPRSCAGRGCPGSEGVTSPKCGPCLPWSCPCGPELHRGETGRASEGGKPAAWQVCNVPASHQAALSRKPLLLLVGTLPGPPARGAAVRTAAFPSHPSRPAQTHSGRTAACQEVPPH